MKWKISASFYREGEFTIKKFSSETTKLVIRPSTVYILSKLTQNLQRRNFLSYWERGLPGPGTHFRWWRGRESLHSTVDIITPEHSHLETLPGTLGLPGSQSSRPSPPSWGGHHRDSSADWEPRSNNSISTIFSPIGSATCIEYSERII